MVFAGESIFLNILKVFVLWLVLTLLLFKWRFNYWKKIGVSQLSPIIPFGNLKDLILQKCSIGEQYSKLYQCMKMKRLKYVGIYFGLKPILLVGDPDLTKLMLIRDFSHFVNRGIYVNVKKDPLCNNLFHLEDDEWKSMRQKLTPTFTSGKIKTLFNTINDCALDLQVILEKSIKDKTLLDIKEIISCFTTDVIGSAAFGIECNSLKNPDCEFRYYGRKIFGRNFFLKFQFLLIFLLSKFMMDHLPVKLSEQDLENFFIKLVREMVYLREIKNVYRNDFLQILIELRNQTKSDKILTLDQLMGQVFIFFAAGFETTSTTLSFAFYELAVNQSIQKKLRNEIRSVLRKHEGQISYEAVNEMIFLEKVIYETLRKNPPGQTLNRVCTKNYNIPNSSVWIKKGTSVVFPIESMQSDPDYYPDPEIFNPERYMNGNKSNQPWMAFGDGPRMCIGMRFAMIEMKICLMHVINNFKIKLNPKTKTPLKCVPVVLVKTIDGPIYLDIEKI